MYGLITDRTQENILRLAELSKKGYKQMTASEKKEWLGNPLDMTAVNLIPQGPYYSSAVDLKYTNDAIIATANTAGIYLYAVSIIGNAADYEGKTFTLSAEYVGSQIALYWHDDNGYEYAGASLSTGDKVTFTVTENTAKRAYLALYVYVTTDIEVAAGTTARFSKVMLENGTEQHEYVPYVEIVPTKATKGAYNYSDLNRVERTVSEISDVLGLKLVTKTDWTAWDIPRQSDMERYLNNIKVIRKALSIEVGIPESMDKLDYNFANNIEMVLLTALTRSDYFYRSGELFLGEI